MKRSPSANRRDLHGFDLEAFLPYRLAVLSSAVSRAMAREYGRRFGIAIPEWRVLAVLARFAPLTAGGLCGRAAMDKVQVSRALARLIARGWVERAVDPADRRRATLRLTAAGQRAHEIIVPIARRAESDLLAALDTQDRRNLDRILGQLVVCARNGESGRANTENAVRNSGIERD